MSQQQDSLCRQLTVLHNKASEASDYQDGLSAVRPAVRILAKCVAQGHLELLRQSAHDMAHKLAQAGSARPFCQMAMTTLKSVGQLIGGPTEWTSTGVLRLAGASDLDQELKHELLLSDERRHQIHPQPFIEGELSVDKLNQLEHWMAHESSRTTADLQQIQQQSKALGAQVDKLQHQLQDHWKTRHDPTLLSQRVSLARAFVISLDQAERNAPGTLQDMANRATAVIGLSKRLFPSDVLRSYRALLRRAGGDANKVDWMKLLHQLERT
ncbi:MAG: hypothetical protein ACYCW6_21960 [Candidatus Xenobia bacterium]